MIQPYSQNDDLYGKVLYAMNKKDQPNYSEYVKKYISQFLIKNKIFKSYIK